MKTFALFNTQKALFVSMMVIAGLTAAGCKDKEKQDLKEKVGKLEKRSVEVEAKLVEAQTESQAQKQSAAQLQEKLDQAIKDAATTSNLLAVATGKVKQLEAANQKRIDDAKTAEQIPAPVVKDGVYTFPKLMSSSMETLGENLEFSSRFGRSLIFKSVEDGKRLKFDVDQLHSVILGALSIDPEAAKADQAKIDAGNKAFAENSAKSTAAYNANMEQAEGAAAKAAADQAAAQAATRAANQQARQAAAPQGQAMQQPQQGATGKMGKRRPYGN